MGIPSYFSYILKRHKHILKRKSILCDILYLDANSIIYDNLSKEGKLYDNIYDSIMNIIDKFQPAKTFICFDGMAPLSKMVQQKQKRYKSHLTKKILNQTSTFNTNCITPGTEFMNGLNTYLKTKMTNTIVLSGSDEPGEGEYKIFNYIRKEPRELNHIIYGLDADLIMLSLLQLPKKIYLYRETKYFKYLTYIDEKADYILDVGLLGEQINVLMEKDGIKHDERRHIGLRMDMTTIFGFITLVGPFFIMFMMFTLSIFNSNFKGFVYLIGVSIMYAFISILNKTRALEETPETLNNYHFPFCQLFGNEQYYSIPSFNSSL